MHVVACCALALTSVACAARHDRAPNRFVKQGEPTLRLEGDVPPPPRQDRRDQARKLKALQASHAAKASTMMPTLEGRDPRLAAALLRLALFESAEHHRLVADAYRDAGVTDYAHRHYQQAVALSHCDSAAYEGLSQVQRDWGFLDPALGDAHRAVHCRPGSATARNTLGTVLQALGHAEDARQEFQRALEIDPHAAFALNNLCYLLLERGDGAGALDACSRARAEDPSMAAARTNLALTYVMQGDVPAAERALLESPDAVAGQYSLGMLRMSLGRYRGAAEAFDKVVAERPASWEARRRAVEAHARTVTQ